eukprot:7129505-Prymnesium_polylepis.1
MRPSGRSSVNGGPTLGSSSSGELRLVVEPWWVEAWVGEREGLPDGGRAAGEWHRMTTDCGFVWFKV